MARTCLLLVACILVPGAADAQEAPPPLPFFERYCVRCHSPPEPDGLVVLDGSVPLRRRTLRKVLTQLRDGTMPPEGESPRPTPAEARRAAADVRAILERPPESVDPGRVTLRRLNRDELNNTLRDLLGVHSRPADRLPDDDTGYGFDTIGDVLAVPPLYLERALEVAEQAADQAILIYRPTLRRFEAEALPKTARGRNRGGVANFATNGEVAVQLRVPHDGVYILRARAAGDQAGGEPCRMEFQIDGKRVGARRVGNPRSELRLFQVQAKLREGTRTFGVAFTNDFFDAENKDPRQRDRNLVVDWIELEGPTQPPALPAFHRRYVRDSAATPSLAISLFVRRALRRHDADVSPFVRLYRRVRREEGHERAFQAVVVAVLIHPRFLFRVERDPEPGQPARLLDEGELATRLSFFLWSSTPDDALLERAREGTLRERLREETDRLLDDPRASSLVERFAGQWLELRSLERLQPDPRTFPSFDDALRAAMREETERMFEAILREDRSVLDLLRARFTFVNERLAKHYGIPGVAGPRFRRVALPEERAGLLTHASVLTLTSNPTRTSVVRRGKWILEVLLDDPPGDPPPGVDNLGDEPASKRTTSLREQLELHRQRPECATCHNKLDPLGFGLERYDGIGAFRTRAGKHLIDDRGELPGGKRFKGATGLRDYLLAERSEDLVLSLARRLLIFALGRGPRDADEPALRALVRSLAPDYRFKPLVRGLVRLDAFQMRGSAR